MLFHELVGLEKLMLEHNDMVYPPAEVVHQGCDRVRTWCSRRVHDRVMARQHTIVMAVQDILKQVDNVCCLRHFMQLLPQLFVLVVVVNVVFVVVVVVFVVFH